MDVHLSKQQHCSIINQIVHEYVQSAPILLAPLIKTSEEKVMQKKVFVVNWILKIQPLMVFKLFKDLTYFFASSLCRHGYMELWSEEDAEADRTRYTFISNLFDALRSKKAASLNFCDRISASCFSTVNLLSVSTLDFFSNTAQLCLSFCLDLLRY